MLTPNAFSKPEAPSPAESAVLPFRSSESVVFRTPRISAARVTLSPNSSMTSARMKSPRVRRRHVDSDSFASHQWRSEKSGDTGRVGRCDIRRGLTPTRGVLCGAG